MLVKQLMHKVTIVKGNLAVCDAAKIMSNKNIGSVLVEENDDVVGIMTERDVLSKLVAKGYDAKKVKIAEIMHKKIYSVDAKTSIEEASKKMSEKNIRRLIVTDNDKIVGIVTTRSIAKSIRYNLASKLIHIIKPSYIRPSPDLPDMKMF